MFLSFSQYINEAVERIGNKLKSDVNLVLNNLVKTSNDYADMKMLIKAVKEKLDEFGLAIVDYKGKNFTGRVLTSDGKDSFNIASTDMEDENTEMKRYTNKLYMEWVYLKDTNSFLLKECEIK